MAQNKNKGEMTVGEAGKRGGDRVHELVREGKEKERQAQSDQGR